MIRTSVESPAISDQLKQFAERFDRRFSALLTPAKGVPDRLAEAVRYSALLPGKRVRPYLAIRCCELAGGSFDQGLCAAAAVECIHAFSLIHDDLPAMDDDDLRRGRPTNHVVFGEGLAILAGDSLVALAFELIGENYGDRAARAMTIELARGMGWSGMIGGQAADVLGEDVPVDIDLARYIHERKTARLFRTACALGVIAADEATDHAGPLADYGTSLGLAFQIADDLLDLTSSATELGKQVGKDNGAGKQTIPQAVGMTESRRLAEEHVRRALACLEDFGPDADDLRSLAWFVVQRTH